jgi:hypothetical protein
MCFLHDVRDGLKIMCVTVRVGLSHINPHHQTTAETKNKQAPTVKNKPQS